MNMAEKKYFESTLTYNGATANTWDGMWQSALAGISQGTGATNRIGNKIYVHSIRFNVFMKPAAPAAGGVPNPMCRCVIYHNKEAVGNLPASTPSVFAANLIESPRYVPLLNRYAILRDYTHSMFTGAVDGSGYYVVGPRMIFSWVVQPRKKIDYQSNAGTISDLYKDDYGVGCFMTNANTCTMDIRVQVIFSDA